MKLSRNLTAAIAAALLMPALAACKPIDKDAAKADAKAEGATKSDTLKIDGLPTERDQVSYLIGVQVGKNLEEIKGELDMDKVEQGIQDVFAGRKPKMTEEQIMQVMQGFATKMQAKQKKEMEEKSAKNIAEGKKFLEANGKKQGVITTASGLQYEVVKMGTGPKPAATDSVRVHYSGKLLDGTQFDSSYERKAPAEFMVGGMVPGFSEALQLMPVGSKFKVWIPANLGYGEQGVPGSQIGPNSTLNFEIEMIEIGGSKPAQQ